MLTLLVTLGLAFVASLANGARVFIQRRGGHLAQPHDNLFAGLEDEFNLQASAANDNRRPRRRLVAANQTWLREVERA